MGALTGIVHAGAVRSRTELATELSERQYGAIARWQLLELGFTRSRIAHWIRCGRLHRRYPGVYAVGRSGLSTAGQIAAGLLYAGRGAAIGGTSALWWLGLLGRRPGRVHVDAPGNRTSYAEVVIRHPRGIERSLHRGLPVVALPAAIITAANELSRDSLRLVLARAEFRRLLSLTELHAALGSGRAGSAAVRWALGRHLPQLARCVNGFERNFVLLCERHRIPLPEPNARIGRHRPDMLWRAARLVVELDGAAAHATEAQLAADERREAELERRGYQVVRYDWERVARDGDAIADELRDLLA